jgi:Concanavalin A-like lectin/glucanases superfamily
VNGSMATFSWSAASDDHTAAAGLSYNLVVATSPGLVDVNSPLAAVPDGFRRVVRLGAQNGNLSWKLNQLPTATLYWSVQAIDSAFAGGRFAPLQQFAISTCQPVTLAPITNQVRAVGEVAVFHAAPSGTAPFAYQWSRNGTLLPGETNSSLTLPLVALASAGTYCVEVTNACGRATNCAVLAVIDPFDACLISHWKFDEASGNTAVDSANGNPGTLVNGPVRTGGLFGGALRFDGQNDHVNVPDSRSLALTNRFTISLWFKPSRRIDETTGRHDIFQKYASYWLSLNKLGEDGKLVFALNYTGPHVRSQRNSWNSNEWYHAAATLDGTNMNLYVNGVLEGSIATTDTPLNNYFPVQIGGDTENLTYFPGCLDDVRLYGCALPGPEIASLAGAAGGAAGPIISTIPDQTTPPNTPTSPIPFTIGDAATPANAAHPQASCCCRMRISSSAEADRTARLSLRPRPVAPAARSSPSRSPTPTASAPAKPSCSRWSTLWRPA